MNRAVALLAAAETGWTWLYTAGMPAGVSESRRDEIASAAWEFRAWAHHQGFGSGRAALHAAWQFLAGTPQDVTWRCQTRLAPSRGRLDEALVAALVVFGVVVGLPIAGWIFTLGPSAARPDHFMGSAILPLFAVPVILLYGIGSVLAFDRWPVATAVLGFIGALCLAGCFAWWIPELSIIASVGGVFALISGFRSHWLRRRATTLDN